MSPTARRAQVNATRVRLARPTDRLEAVIRFYRDGVGLPVASGFKGQAGYDGVILGVPGQAVELEFTAHQDGSPGAAPSNDNVLALYLADAAEVRRVADRLAAFGHPPVEPANPYWERGVTIADPDGWRIVLVADGS